MSALELQYREGGIHLPRLGLWLDPRWPTQDLVFVSHAHSDHVADHREVILSEPTARLMAARMGGQRIEHGLHFGETRRFVARDGAEFILTLLPAGHIFGSAMALIEAGGESLLYTGDFKLRRSRSAEPCEPRHADLLVMETTYGRSEYRFPATEDVMRSVVRFCREALDNDETAVLYGYSLGKSQELLCGLADAGLPIVLHGSVHHLTKVYEQFGHCFPPYERYEPGQAQHKVVLCPPSVSGSAMLRRLGKTRCAVLTGWAVDPACKYRYRCDAAFPLSDHADFPDLIEFVTQVQPRKVFTLHGFAADFAATLRGLGYDAKAVSEDEQLSFGFSTECPRPCGTAVSNSPAGLESATTFGEPPSIFARFAATCSTIASTTSKLEKIRLVAEYLRSLNPEGVGIVTTWFTGTPFAAIENRVLQVGWALLRDAICSVAGVSTSEFHHAYLKHSDLGETAFELWQLRPQGGPNSGAPLSLQELQAGFAKLEKTRGSLAKLPELVALLRRCAALEAKFLVKIITSDLRIGLKEGLVEDAIAQAFTASAEEVRKANLLLGNIGQTAILALQNRLREAAIEPFRPVKCMLASAEETAAGIWERLGHHPVWLEDKYDGIRCQLHKVGSRVALFSRDLKNITETFPELAGAARLMTDEAVLDGEILAMRDDEVLPFSDLQRRLGRREHDLFMREEIPIQFIAFDLLWTNGATYVDQPLRARRRALEAITLPAGLRLARITQADSPEDIEATFNAARRRNNEGLLAKDPDSVYSPGRRGLSWLKLKRPHATLDCVVVGAEYGHGKRSQVLSDYTFAVRDESTGELKTIGKAYTGLTDREIADLTQHFLSRTIECHGRYHVVEPDTVVEIAFDRIQPSGRHASGLALRFPRIVRRRTDKTAADIDTLETARRLAISRTAR